MPRNAGFTLIEILIAMVIFAILSSITMYAIHDILAKYRHIDASFKIWHQIDNFINRIQYQSRFYVNRGVKGDEGHIFPAFVGQRNYIEWTYIDRLENLKRIAYLCQDGHLSLRQWLTIDSLSRKQYQDQVLLDNLSSCQFKYLGTGQDVLNQWDTDKGISPSGVQINLTFKNQKNLQFWFTFPPETYEFEATSN